jgi:hypothetical protein
VSGREGGSGLGLTLAQTFVQQHQGTIECDSEPGRTVFKILSPDAKPAPMKTIWIVDDDQSIRFVLEKALAREQLPVRSFANPARCWRRWTTTAAGAGQRHPHARRLGPGTAGKVKERCPACRSSS